MAAQALTIGVKTDVSLRCSDLGFLNLRLQRLYIFRASASLHISRVGPTLLRPSHRKIRVTSIPICTFIFRQTCTLDNESLDMPFSALFNRKVSTFLVQSSEKSHAHQLIFERAPMKYAG